MRRFSRQMNPPPPGGGGLVFAVGCLQASRSLAISAGSGLSGCCSAKLLGAMLPVKAGTGTDFTSGVPSPLDDQTQCRGNLLPPPPDE